MPGGAAARAAAGAHQVAQMLGPAGQEVQPFEAQGSHLAVALFSTQPSYSHSRQVVASLHFWQWAGHLRGMGWRRVCCV